MSSIYDAALKCKGLYTITEAALYARIHPSTMTRWLQGSGQGESVVDAKFIDGTYKYVGFLDFVQALAIHDILFKFKKTISLPKIREAVKRAKDEYGIEYPFARRHCLFADGKSIVIKYEKDRMAFLTGKSRDQMIFREILEPYLKDISFDADGIAIKYTPPFSYKGRTIIMDPCLHFGEPIVSKYKIPASILSDAVKTEGSVEEVISTFGVDEDEVWTAIKYFDFLNGKPISDKAA